MDLLDITVLTDTKTAKSGFICPVCLKPEEHGYAFISYRTNQQYCSEFCCEYRENITK